MCIAELTESAQSPRYSIGSQLGVRLAVLYACVLFGARQAEAHPVSQGALRIVICSDHVNVHATVSREEVLVAAAFKRQEDALYPEILRIHGDYLLVHFRLTANGRQLVGRVVEYPDSAAGRPTYTLEYRMPGVATAHIVLQQDVLRECEFAPGNRWEANYLVSIGLEGQPPLEGVLLTSREPLRFYSRGPSAASTPGVSMLDRVRMAAAFVRYGIMHILSGYDHLLFVGALLLAVTTLWDLVKVISAFTLAHTITLTVAALDIFRLPGEIVEPMIAASIVLVAVQNVVWPEQSRGWSRLLVAFFFGLFHGLGFAGGLLDAMSGMHVAVAVMAIAAFSVGVEIGHQIVVLPVFCGLRLLRRAYAEESGPDRLVRRYGSAVISVVGMVYLVAALR